MYVCMYVLKNKDLQEISILVFVLYLFLICIYLLHVFRVSQDTLHYAM